MKERTIIISSKSNTTYQEDIIIINIAFNPPSILKDNILQINTIIFIDIQIVEKIYKIL